MRFINSLLRWQWKVVGQAGLEQARIEAWKWLLLLGLGVPLFEWYVYNRRVYL